MRIVSHILKYVLAAMLFAACTNEDILQNTTTGGVEGAGTISVTFSAKVDYSIDVTGSGAAKVASTRVTADADESPTRFYGQAISSEANAVQSEVVEGVLNPTTNKYEFSFHLTSEASYTYMFWADNADAGASVPTDLTAVEYTPGCIAFTAKASGTPENVSTDITLKHVVTKVTLQHDGSNLFRPRTNDVLAISLPCANSYNVSMGAATGSDTQHVTHTFGSNASIGKAVSIFSFYNLATSNANSVTLTFCNDYTLTISNVNLQANTHVTLQGDLSSKNSSWIVPEEKRKEVFLLCLFDENGFPKGEQTDYEDFEYYADYDIGRFFIDKILNIEYRGGYVTQSAKIGDDIYDCMITAVNEYAAEMVITKRNYGNRYVLCFGTMWAADEKNFLLPADFRFYDW